MQQHFYRLDCWDQLAPSSSNIWPLPGLSSSLYCCFPLQSCPPYKQTVLPSVVLFEPPWQIWIDLVIKEQRSIPCWAFQGHTGTSPSEQRIPLLSPCLNKEQQCPTKQNRSHFALGWCSCELQVPQCNSNFILCCYFGMSSGCIHHDYSAKYLLKLQCD